MRHKIAVLLLVVGAVLVVIGFVMRSTEVHATGATGYFSCGTAASPNTGQAYRDGLKLELSTPVIGGPAYGHENMAQCDDALSTRGTWSWVLIGLGAAALIGGVLTFVSSALASPRTARA